MQYPAGPLRYHGYLLRFWQERSQRGVKVVWRFSLDDPRTGKRRGFADLDALIAAMQCEMEAACTLSETLSSVFDEMEEPSMSQQFNPDDERAIRALVAQIEAGWNAGSGEGFAAPFAEDADYVIVDGRQIKGHNVIEQGHQQIFDTIYRGSTNRGTIQSVHFLRDDVALVHVEWHLTFSQGDAMLQRRAINSMVLTKEDGPWSIVAFQNTPIDAFGA